MDAIEFFKEYHRMCNFYVGETCNKCPASKLDCCGLYTKNYEEIIQIVEQWSQAHPQKTMMQDFFEKFPNAPKSEDGTPRDVCPGGCGYVDEPNNYSVCEKFEDGCLKCWSRPLEE